MLYTKRQISCLADLKWAFHKAERYIRCVEFIRESVQSVRNMSAIGDTDNLFTAKVSKEVQKKHGHIEDYTKRDLYQSFHARAYERNCSTLQTNQSLQASEKQSQYNSRSKMHDEHMSLIDYISGPTKSTKEVSGHVVALTSSTGALNSHLLHTLLAEVAVTHIYWLNRAVDSSVLQAERN